MRLTLSASTSPAVAATPRYTLRCPDRRPPDANVFLELEERLREILSVTPRELGNTRRTRILVTPDNEGTICSCGERVVGKLARFHPKIGTSPTNGPGYDV